MVLLHGLAAVAEAFGLLLRNVVCAALPLAAPAPPPGTAALALELPPVAVRSEHFAVHRSALEPAAGAAASAPETIAVVRLVRLDGERRTLIERETTFRSEGWSVHHVDVLEGSLRRSTWRESGPSGRRAWTAEWDLASRDAGREARVVGYGWRRPVHETIRGEAPLCGALERLEARRTALALPAAAVLDPVAARARCAGAEPAERAAVTPVELAGFEQAGARIVVEPIDAARYAELAGRFRRPDPARHPAVEAALRRDATLRALGRRFAAGELIR